MHYQTSLMICHPYLVKQQNDEFMNLVLRFFVAQGTLPELLELCWSACRDDALQIRILRLMAQ